MKLHKLLLATALSLPFAAHAQDAPKEKPPAISANENKPGANIKTIPVITAWRDVIALEIADKELKTKVEAFLDFLEKSSFPFSEANPDTGRIISGEVSGQQMLATIGQIAGFMNRPGSSLKRLSKDGKFTINMNDQDYDPQDFGTQATVGWAAVKTMFGDYFPANATLGADYLKGAKYPGKDGETHSVSVDGVMTYILGIASGLDISGGTGQEMEKLVLSHLGGAEREKGPIQFEKGGNNGYVTLFDKIEKPVKPQPLPEREFQ